MAIQTKPRKKTSTEKSQNSFVDTLKKLNQQNSLTQKDRKFFTEQMALLLETGSNLQTSLQALLQQVHKPAMSDIVQQLLNDIEQGKQFSTALAKFPKFFSNTYVNLIAASESGGYMHEVLEQLQEMEEKREKLHQTMTSSLSYPIFLLVFALSVVIFVLVVVFPKFSDLFSQIQDQLPATTVFLMATSSIIQNYWGYITIAVISFIIAINYWSSTETGKISLDSAKLHFPLIKGIFTQLYLVQSLRVLSLSLRNGVNIMESLQACREVVDNKVFRNFILHIEDSVEQGKGIAIGFQNTPFIPPIVAQMIKTGEETGSLTKVLQRLADYYETELTNKLATLSRLAEPIMLLIMGGVVGLIVSSLILPIFKLSRAVG